MKLVKEPKNLGSLWEVDFDHYPDDNCWIEWTITKVTAHRVFVCSRHDGEKRWFARERLDPLKPPPVARIVIIAGGPRQRAVGLGSRVLYTEFGRREADVSRRASREQEALARMDRGEAEVHALELTDPPQPRRPGRPRPGRRR